jgi:hypothetical protein
VVNIARYYHHKTVYVGSKEDNIYNNIYKGLDITKAINYKLKDLIIPLRPARVKISIRKGRSFNKKRSFSYTNALLPPSKCICSGSPFKGKRHLVILNQVHQHVITKDYKKPLYKISFWAAILATLKSGIKEYKFSYT